MTKILPFVLMASVLTIGDSFSADKETGAPNPYQKFLTGLGEVEKRLPGEDEVQGGKTPNASPKDLFRDIIAARLCHYGNESAREEAKRALPSGDHEKLKDVLNRQCGTVLESVSSDPSIRHEPMYRPAYTGDSSERVPDSYPEDDHVEVDNDPWQTLDGSSLYVRLTMEKPQTFWKSLFTVNLPERMVLKVEGVKKTPLRRTETFVPDNSLLIGFQKTLKNGPRYPFSILSFMDYQGPISQRFPYMCSVELRDADNFRP